MSTSVTRRFAFVLLVLLAVGLAACSSDDGGTESAGDGTTAEASDDGEDGDDAGGFEPTVEQCEAVGSVPEDAAALDETVALFPEDLQEDVRQFGDDLAAYVTSFDDQTGEPSAPEPEPSEALTPVFETCTELLAGDDGGTTDPNTAEFAFGDIRINGETAIISVSGACSDGTYPTEVELVYGPFSAVAPGVDLATVGRASVGGEYEFTIDVAAGATEAALQDELGLDPESIESSITGTCG